MMLNLKCPSCGESQLLSDEVLGQKVSCPSCGAGFRVNARKPNLAADPAPAVTPPRPAATIPDPSPRAPQPQVRPAVTRQSKPSPAVETPDPTGTIRRGGLPTWAYAALGCVAASALVATAFVFRTLGGSSSSPYPDPAVDVAIGVASGSGPSPAQPVVATATTPPVLASRDVPPAPASAPAPVAARAPLPPPSAPATGNAPLSTSQIVARWEPSVALVKGHASSGTGFLVKPGIIATNAHVIGEEFISDLEIRFPSAPAGKQGPFPAELLYEDARRDLAFLAVDTDLPVTDVAPSYAFVKGEDITVVGNPGLGDETVIENAISRGVMSSKTVIEGNNLLQMNISINPGNSGGPVFDSTGRVIGVATLNATKAEALAFCIPVEDLQAAMKQVGPARARFPAPRHGGPQAAHLGGNPLWARNRPTRRPPTQDTRRRHSQPPA
jgi:S1-C subfamily serine protease